MGSRIWGVHAVYEALVSGKQPVERIHVARETRSPRLHEILELARERGVPVRKEERSVLDELATGGIHQGIVAIAGDFQYGQFETLFQSDRPLVVILDGVEDPHNLGAVVRTAEASGATGVILPERHSAPVSSTVIKAAAGALEYVPVVRVTNLVSAIGELKAKNIWVVGVDPSGDRLWTDYDYTGPIALVLGGEHRGVRRLVKEACDVVVRLPMQGKISSLNVSVAAGIVLFEVVRQRTSR